MVVLFRELAVGRSVTFIRELTRTTDDPGKQDLHHTGDQTHEVPQIDAFQALLTDVLEHDLNQYLNSTRMGEARV